MPSLTSKWIHFGKSTPVILHGRETVISKPQAAKIRKTFAALLTTEIRSKVEKTS